MMESDRLEKGLLINHDDDDDEQEQVLYSASFAEGEDDLIKLKTIEWILYSFLLIFAWGFGFLMLLFLPLRRYLLRRTIRSQRLYLTPHSIVYNVCLPLFLWFTACVSGDTQAVDLFTACVSSSEWPVTKPAALCVGVLTIEKHVLLHSVSDVVVQQGGFLQSRYGVYSVRILNASHTIIQIQGVANPNDFRKAVLTRLSNVTNETFHQDVASSTRVSHAPLSPLKAPTHDTMLADFALLQKLDQVGKSLKRVQSLIEERQQKTSQSKD
ncbi:hypothetical protein Tco_1294711 [Tanacetum coccineum]